MGSDEAIVADACNGRKITRMFKINQLLLSSSVM